MSFRTGFLAILALSAGCAGTYVLDNDNALVVTPLEIGQKGHIIVEASIDGGGPYRFALDTGASISVIFDSARIKAGLELVEGERVVIQGMIGSDAFPVTTIPQLQLGGESWTNARVASLPREGQTSDKLDGILGVDFISRYALGVSVQDQVVRFYPTQLVSERTYSGWTSVPMRQVPVGSSDAVIYTIEVRINRIPIAAMLDLGAGTHLMNWHTATRIGGAAGRSGRDTEISGAVETVPVAAELVAEKLWIENISWKNTRFVVSDFPVFEALGMKDGMAAIIGPGLFSERDLVIDFERQRLLVGRKK